MRSITKTIAAAAMTAALAVGATTVSAADAAIAAAVDGPARSAAQKERDDARHPVQSLEFWGLAPGMTVLEVQPGAASYWTEILAPHARATGGQLYVTGPDVANAKNPEASRKSLAALEAALAQRADDYGDVKIVAWGAESAPLPADTFDLILTARSVHGWMRGDMVDKAFTEFHRALKPGGILALEQHRAAPGEQDPKAATGYVTEAYVIDAARKAGLELVERSDINANPKDTKDHPFGVWTLPPTRVSVAYGSGRDADPDFDHAPYDAIGESDRMTLKFRKP